MGKSLLLHKYIFLFFICIPTCLLAQEIGNVRVNIKDYFTFTWDSPGGDIQGYNLYRSSAADTLGKKINRKVLSSNKYTDYSAGAGKIYYYQVQGLDKEKNPIAFSTPVPAYISPFHSVTVRTPTAFQKKEEPGEYLFNTKYLFSRKPLVGLNLDFILSYYIGRLFGKNDPYGSSKYRTDYITRIGLWLLTVDGKLTLPYLENRLFSLALGGRYTYMFRDISQPSPGAAPTFTIKPGKSASLPATYVAVSKAWTKNAVHIGALWGKEDEVIPSLSEYIYYYYYKVGQWQKSKAIVFGGIHTRIIPHLNLKIEALNLLGNPLKPWLFNIDLGRFLPANFQLAYFCYKYGWDILGYFNFRYTFYPPQK